MPGTDFSIHAVNPAAQGPAPAATKAAAAGESHFGFDDLLDIVNPLQHFPVVSTLYKHLTGDQIGVPEKILGDTLYGGMLGLFSSIGDAIFTELTGKSVGDTVYAMVLGDDDAKPAVAQTDIQPVAVQPASSEDIALPHFSFLDSQETDGTPPAPSADTLKRAAKAYHATGKFLSF